MELAARLGERRSEMEQAALARVYGISDPALVEDPEYAAGLRAAVRTSLAYALEALDSRSSEDRLPPIPLELLTQARYAARSGVSLDAVLRRYFAGYSLLCDFLTQAAEKGPEAACELQRALRRSAMLFDRLSAVVSEEYGRESQGRSHTSSERRIAQVRMLLGGESVDVAELGYGLDAWHVGLVASGPGVKVALRQLAENLDRRLLAVCADGGMVWAWLGGRKRLPSREILGRARASWSRDCLLAVGEPGQGLRGWRLGHRQAKAAFLVARLGPERQVAYSDVALTAAIIQDEVLSSSLPRIYLDPLAVERDDGVALRQTLHAYFATERNVSSAAAELGISRRTVASRLRRVEERLGRPLNSCNAELEAALRLETLVG